MAGCYTAVSSVYGGTPVNVSVAVCAVSLVYIPGMILYHTYVALCARFLPRADNNTKVFFFCFGDTSSSGKPAM